MKRLMTFLSLPLLLASCSKDEDLSAAKQQGDEAVQFSASLVEMTQSRAITLHNTWGDDDQIVIFIENTDGSFSEAYIYDVDATGAMSIADGGEAITYKESDDIQTTFYAFSPYNASYTSIEDYQTLQGGDVDMISSKATGSDAASFTFSHDLAALYFDLPLSEASAAMISAGSDSYTLSSDDIATSGEGVSFSLFVLPSSDISDAMLVIDNGYYSLSSDEVSSWEAGKTYTYSSIQ